VTSEFCEADPSEFVAVIWTRADRLHVRRGRMPDQSRRHRQGDAAPLSPENAPPWAA